MADSGNSAVDNSTDPWSEWPQILNTCDRCEVDFDSIEEAHTNLCGVCQLLFPEDDAILVTCDICDTKYDCIKQGNGSFCGTCLALKVDAANTTTTAAPPKPQEALMGPTLPSYHTPPPTSPQSSPPARAPRRRLQPAIAPPGQAKCQTCGRIYMPNRRNTVLDCTWCCNSRARKGWDFFAKVGLPRSTQAEEGLQQLLLKQAAGGQVVQSSSSSSIGRNLPSIWQQSKATTGGKTKASEAAGKKRVAEALESEDLEERERAKKRIKTEQDGAW